MRMGSLVLQIWLRSQEASRAWALVETLGRAALYRQLPSKPVAAASESYSELEELLRDTPEPSTPPVESPAPGPLLTPGAAKITEEASYGTTEDMGAVVDELQAWVEEQLHWLKGDTSSLETLSESEETAPGDLVPELHNGVFRFRDPEPVCTDEID